MFAAAKKSDNLSQSALNYLQSLEKATKALRQNESAQRKHLGQNTKAESSHTSSERSSLSLMISQLRQRTRTGSNFDESDDDKSVSGSRSQDGTAKPSSSCATSSSADGERIVFDFPFDDVKDENKRNALPHELPGLQVIQKNLLAIRELRSSIDNSLIRPPTPQRHQLRRPSTASVKDSFELHDKSEDDKADIMPKSNATKSKSPFWRTIESGSDLESIDFEENVSPRKSVDVKEFSKSSTSSSKSNSSRTSTTRSSTSSQSRSSSAAHRNSNVSRSRSSTASSSVSKSSASSSVNDDEDDTLRTLTTMESLRSASESTEKHETESSRGDASRTKSSHHQKEKKKRITESLSPDVNGEDDVQRIKSSAQRELERMPAKPQKRSNRHSPSVSRRLSESPDALRASSSVTLTRIKKSTPLERETSPQHYFTATPLVLKRPQKSKKFSEHSTQTEQSRSQQFPEFCSTNLHHVMSDVLRTHLRLLREFNRLEWASLQEWNAIVDEIRENYDGPTTKKLQAIVEKYTENSIKLKHTL